MSEYISEKGILLNDFGHELRDEEGALIYIEPKYRNNYEVLADDQRGIEAFVSFIDYYRGE